VVVGALASGSCAAWTKYPLSAAYTDRCDTWKQSNGATMAVLLTSTQTSMPFAQRLSDALGIPLAAIDRQDFPDGEHYLRFDISERLGLLGQHVVIVAATENAVSIDEVYRLGCAA